jgi:hypothetical protein
MRREFPRNSLDLLPYAGPVLNIDEAMAADHTAHRKMVTELGAYRGLGTPIKFSRTPGGTRGAPPHFNEHGEAVLRELGFSDSQIVALAHEGVLVRSAEGRARGPGAAFGTIPASPTSCLWARWTNGPRAG